MPESQQGKGFTIKRRVHFSETDRAGVLYFAHYYRFMEEAEHAFRHSLGMSIINKIDGCETSWPRVETSCTYFAPVHFNDELELEFKIAHIGNKSIRYVVEFRRDDLHVATGEMTAVYSKIVDGHFQSMPIPQSLKDTLRGGTVEAR